MIHYRDILGKHFRTFLHLFTFSYYVTADIEFFFFFFFRYYRLSPFYFYLFYFWPQQAACGDLSSPTRDRTGDPCIGSIEF